MAEARLPVGEDIERELAATADAHLLVRAVLLHPDLVPELRADPGQMSSDNVAANTRLSFVLGTALLGLGTQNVRDAEELLKPQVSGSFAGILRGGVEAFEEHRDNSPSRGWHILQSVLRSVMTLPVRGNLHPGDLVLEVITAAASIAGHDRAAWIAQRLLTHPALFGFVGDEEGEQSELDDPLRRRMLARAAAVCPDAVGRLAGDLAAICGGDRGRELALRAEAEVWWQCAVEVMRRRGVELGVVPGGWDCPDPGGSLLRGVIRSGTVDPNALIADLPTSTVVVAVAQAVAALGVALRGPNLPLEIILATEEHDG